MILQKSFYYADSILKKRSLFLLLSMLKIYLQFNIFVEPVIIF